MIVYQLVNSLFHLLQLLILARVIWSWVDRNPYSTNPVRLVLWQLTEPLLEPIRRLLPPVGGAIDFSPLVAIVLLQVLQQVLFQAVR